MGQTSRRGRPRALNDEKKKEILAILHVGGSRRVAASYVGVSASTIANEADRDTEFLDSLARAEAEGKVAQIRKIAEADDWRAALAWLARKYPEEWSEQKRVERSGNGQLDANAPGIEVLTDANWYGNADQLNGTRNQSVLRSLVAVENVF